MHRFIPRIPFLISKAAVLMLFLYLFYLLGKGLLDLFGSWSVLLRLSDTTVALLSVFTLASFGILGLLVLVKATKRKRTC